MKYTALKIAAAAGMAFASLAPAQAARTFTLTSASVDVVDSWTPGTDLNVDLASPLPTSFTLNEGESFTFDFINIDIDGAFGGGWAKLLAGLTFDPPGSGGSAGGEGAYATAFNISAGLLTWDAIDPIVTDSAIYTISFGDLAGVTLSNSTTVKATVTLVSEVPEPATWAMLIAGFGLVGGAMRLRRREEGLALAA